MGILQNMNEIINILSTGIAFTLLYLIFILISLIIFWLLIRPIVIWYFKINKIIEELEKINKQLETNNKTIKPIFKKKIKTDYEKWGPKKTNKIKNE